MNTPQQRLFCASSILYGLLVMTLSVALSGCFSSSSEDPPPALGTQPSPTKPENPTAVDDTLSVPPDPDFSGVVSVLDNDSAAVGATISIDAFDSNGSNGGSIINNGDGSLTYTPPGGFEGEDAFSYTIKDSNNLTASATVTVTVSATVIPNGMAFYAGNCAICHAAGTADTSNAFNGSDLNLSSNPLTKDLTVYGGEYQLMGAFYNLEQKQVDELKAYLGSL